MIYQVQNADDNTYPEDVEPTLAFILQENGIAVLNNERGFSAENIRALCDIGNSTKKGSNQGYIGNKGIGFKSVFRVGINIIITSKLLYCLRFHRFTVYCLFYFVGTYPISCATKLRATFELSGGNGYTNFFCRLYVLYCR